MNVRPWFWLAACECAWTAAPEPRDAAFAPVSRAASTADTGCAEPRLSGTPSPDGCLLGPIEAWCATGADFWGEAPSETCSTFEQFLTQTGFITGTSPGTELRVVRCGLATPYDVVYWPESFEPYFPTEVWYFEPSGVMVAQFHRPCGWPFTTDGAYCWEDEQCCGDGVADGREWYGPPVDIDCEHQVTHVYKASEFPSFPGYPEPADTGEAPTGGCGGCDVGGGLGGGLGSLLIAVVVTAQRRRRTTTGVGLGRMAGTIDLRLAGDVT